MAIRHSTLCRHCRQAHPYSILRTRTTGMGTSPPRQAQQKMGRSPRMLLCRTTRGHTPQWGRMDDQGYQCTLGLSFKAIWMERNDAYHGADDQETQLKRSDDLNDLIVRSYQLDRHHQAVTHTHPFINNQLSLYSHNQMNPDNPGCALLTQP